MEGQSGVTPHIADYSMDELRRQLLQTQERMEKQQVLIEQLLQERKNSGEKSPDIRPDEYIKVMSLVPHNLNMTTLPKSQGKIFTWRKWGEVKKIFYGDLVLLLENHPTFLEQGKFYIMDRRVIQNHGLEDIYARILDKSLMEKILNGDNQTDAVNIFRTAGETQKEMMCAMMIQRIVNGENVDLNLADRLSRVMQENKPKYENYDISKKAEEAKALSGMR